MPVARDRLVLLPDGEHVFSRGVVDTDAVGAGTRAAAKTLMTLAMIPRRWRVYPAQKSKP